MERKTTDGEGLLHRDKIAGRRTAAAEQNKGIQEDREVQQEFFLSEARGAQHGLPDTLQSTQTEPITCITGLASGELTAEATVETTAEAAATCSGVTISI